MYLPASNVRWPTWEVKSSFIKELKVVNTSNGNPAIPPMPYDHARGAQNKRQGPKQPPQISPHSYPPLPSQRDFLPMPQNPANRPPQNLTTPIVSMEMPAQEQAAPQARQASSFVDPAIMSIGRSPARNTAAPMSSVAEKSHSTLMTRSAAEGIKSQPNSSSPLAGDAGKGNNDSGHAVTGERSKYRNPSAVPHGMGTEDTKKPSRRGQKKKAAATMAARNGAAAAQAPPAVMNSEVTRNGNDMNTNVRRGKGWRQTPLLQPSPRTSSPASGGTRKSRRQPEKTDEMGNNGWATEDATDMPDDFDFEANLKLFDKKGVFDQLRQDDTTADEERLVGHNRIQKNLGPNENVLSPHLSAKNSPQDLGSSSASDADTESKFAANQPRAQSRNESHTRAQSKAASARQTNVLVDAKPHPLAASVSSERGISMTRSVTSGGGKAAKVLPVSFSTASPRPERGHSPYSVASASATRTPKMPAETAQKHLAVHPSMTPCPVLLPLALETLESETVSRFGLGSEAITESAARSIAEQAVSMFDIHQRHSVGGQRGSRQNSFSMSDSRPVVVVLAGNHATGARALAAARHIFCRRARVIIAETALDGVTVPDSSFTAQVSTLKRLIKSGASITRGPWRNANKAIRNLPAPPALIIDALLAGATYVALSSAPNLQLEARQMIDWANRSRAPVLSVTCPSGVSAVDGLATMVDGEPLAIRPDRLLALGFPVHGVLGAMREGERWDVALADVGINLALREEERVLFDSAWVVPVRLVGEETAEGS